MCKRLCIRFLCGDIPSSTAHHPLGTAHELGGCRVCDGVGWSLYKFCRWASWTAREKACIWSAWEKCGDVCWRWDSVSIMGLAGQRAGNARKGEGGEGLIEDASVAAKLLVPFSFGLMLLLVHVLLHCWPASLCLVSVCLCVRRMALRMIHGLNGGMVGKCSGGMGGGSFVQTVYGLELRRCSPHQCPRRMGGGRD